jgi:hypothetical protein
MKVTKELAEVFANACKRVGEWEGWQRSLDPQGGDTRTSDTSTADRVDSNGQMSRPVPQRRSA